MRAWLPAPALLVAAAAASFGGCAKDRARETSSSGVHAADFVDGHRQVLRSARYAPMIDASSPDACGRCHRGAPATPAGVTSAAPGAPDCTSCHTSDGGPLACTTCHGGDGKPYPEAGAHAAHAERSAARATGLACTTCHPALPPGVIAGTHADGVVEVAFDPSLVAASGNYDPTSGGCVVSCHARGGDDPQPRWSDTKEVSCNDCHRSPPANHFPGPCTGCHVEANADGTALTPGPLHINGRVDIGSGGTGCARCHGHGDDPWPTSASHPTHESPPDGAPVTCASCHPVPASVDSPGHRDGVVQIVLSGVADARGAVPSWDGARCSNVACHGANLADAPAVVPQWRDTSGAARACGSCHPIPPSQHTTSTSCDRAECHGSEIARDANAVLSITAAGRALHINGVIDVQ